MVNLGGAGGESLGFPQTLCALETRNSERSSYQCESLKSLGCALCCKLCFQVCVCFPEEFRRLGGAGGTERGSEKVGFQLPLSGKAGGQRLGGWRQVWHRGEHHGSLRHRRCSETDSLSFTKTQLSASFFCRGFGVPVRFSSVTKVGADWHTGPGGTGSGAAYVFAYDGSWNQEA